LNRVRTELCDEVLGRTSFDRLATERFGLFQDATLCRTGID